LDELTEMDGTDAEAAAIEKMASSKSGDEVIEKEMDENSDGDAKGEYNDLQSTEDAEV